MNRQLIIIVLAILVLALIGIVLFGMKRKEGYYGNSPAFDPTTRGGVAGIGPSHEENKEGFCGTCA